MENQLSRTQLILGKEAIDRLAAARVAVFGIGGVGGYVAEALARSGIGALDIIDNDKISVTNINRQIYATTKTIGEYKTDVAARRITEINPDITVNARKTFFLPDNSDEFDFTEYDYIVDAVDTITAKIELIVKAEEANVPIISSMGTGNKLNPAEFEVADIYDTSVCPLARVMRTELKKRGIKSLKVVYSKEKPIPHKEICTEEAVCRKQIPGSTSFVPPVAGFIIASEVVKDLIGYK